MLVSEENNEVVLSKRNVSATLQSKLHGASSCDQPHYLHSSYRLVAEDLHGRSNLGLVQLIVRMGEPILF